MTSNQETWGSRAGFILAAVGSCIGLGNIWRFPYMVYENGGGAFLIPYFVAMLTAGIPLLILEFAIGHKFEGSAPRIFASISRRWEWLGWWQVMVAFVISLYYVAVIGWAISYVWFAMTQAWGTDTGTFFMNTFLNVTDSPLNFGGMNWPVFGTIVLAWGACWGILFGGVQTGIERANKIFMPLLIILVLIIMGRVLFLPGAMEGLNWLFKPDFAALTKGSVWIAAYGQIFYTLGVGFAIMVTYASYLPKDSDVNNNAVMTVFIDGGFAILAGIMIFGVLGYMAAAKGVAVNEVVSSGVGLCFVTIPQAINFLPMPKVFGTLFFTAIVVAGISSQISICEACVAAIRDKFDISRKTAVTAYCLAGFAGSAIFACDGGLLVLDVVDHFINNFGVLMTGLVEITAMAWLFNIEDLRKHINAVSDFAIGRWWVFSLKFVTPLLLGYMAIQNLVGDIAKPYGGYPTAAVTVFGWSVVAGVVLLGWLIQTVKAYDPARISK
ncbi:NSS family neurotransmitter:Na+ symporter [Desulfobaculum xiamenense]|uniref:Transporter n=1 Tax=Desulfobaculum xiamenense TaxID=995050 RepID=A0A846QUR0_9BACT|nr:sodium-dependent transporter [Desulfobaculum xiamenense]NJB69275.1 NSS family neurotransmitter:Na+ symporter [Desulfobaculum xiamenense]